MGYGRRGKGKRVGKGRRETHFRFSPTSSQYEVSRNKPDSMVYRMHSIMHVLGLNWQSDAVTVTPSVRLTLLRRTQIHSFNRQA
jgi:hypothetical protein